ncbi:MAG: DUF4910 domain-containing protein [Defluviitaleaceae bacterium]|nr:DUF4910 domain-containing protein [Defluviitaleaceae bacterium]MCL2238360.1 DUF4910 domain-containing protein [Defluviitaleaceae bacterium]
MSYISFLQIAHVLGIKKGDNILVSSDITRLAYLCCSHGEKFDTNLFIDSLKEAVGEGGSLVFPTYNWDFCKGIAFDYRASKSEVGSLSDAALKRNDFTRTRHPIYSYAVWGRDREALYSLANRSAWGEGSPFDYFYHNGYKNLAIDVAYDKFATFIHYCEEKVGTTYRYMKDFTGEYINERGVSEGRTYSMYVRPQYYNVTTQIYKMDEIWQKNGVVREFEINGLPFVLVDMKKACDLTEADIKYNHSRNIVAYPGYGMPTNTGISIHMLAVRLFPICRSLTGNGVRKTLNVLQEIVPQMQINEVPSGTQVFDWTVPNEWNIKDAYIKDENGSTILSFAHNNLHVVGYSAPIDKMVTRNELMEMVYTQPDQPDVIPYVTSYYKERSGFCMTEHQRETLNGARYHVYIDSELKKGSLTYGEIVIPGESEQEILLSSYICHPSMANNELSGPCVAIHLAKWLLEQPRRYSYRIIFIPETIGPITYLSRNLEAMKKRVIAGFNLTCVGDNHAYSYIASRYGDTLADRVAKNILRFHAPGYRSYSYLQRGSDERQYNAPGVDLPVCVICRSKFGEFPEYHTSDDNLEFISPEGLGGAFDVYQRCIIALENNYKYRIKCLGEPQLGKRGLYPTVSQKGQYDEVKSMMDFIAYADGLNDLISISNIINVSINDLIPIIKKLCDVELLEIGGNKEHA